MFSIAQPTTTTNETIPITHEAPLVFVHLRLLLLLQSPLVRHEEEERNSIKIERIRGFQGDIIRQSTIDLGQYID
ncbi:hypothetical protein BLOT_005566 [Blomia tropicalis]|nr:hypothetical protein BLOT_005566 [Blomia tropicalis]